ncbi:MAG: hypothetical protein K6C68_06680 [Ruminococcus sp.]|nr:hypothetical protein [Ruminococcus sp.]
MGYSEMKCSHCGKMNRESCNAWMYGSPIRFCKKCGEKYIDRRYREPAIQGFDNRTMSAELYLKIAPIFAGIFVLALIWNRYTVTHLGYFTTYQILFMLVGGLGAVGGIVQYFRIKLGIEEKSNQRYLAESEERLKNPEYVADLIANGFNVPEKYRPAEETDGGQDD